MKVLVVDDSPEVSEVVSLCFELRWPGTATVSAPDGPTGLELLARENPDLVVLDIGLPGMDGFQVCREMRRRSQVPIIMLTVRDEDVDIARGLEMGADDYITKPFSHIELLARAHAVLRRGRGAPSPGDASTVLSGDLRVDLDANEVWRGGQRVRLTTTEYNILAHLVRNANNVVSHRSLLSKVWGVDRPGSTGFLKVHIQHLRQKLGDDTANPRIIVTEWRSGYKFVKLPPPEDGPQGDGDATSPGGQGAGTAPA